MCRFVAYLGRQAILLDEVLNQPENSLINQSREAREGKTGLNADGFGIGWYDHSIDNKAGIFKSIQPAWNDKNLHHLSAKIRSNCFIGHVRASTVGDVNTFNCHPFSHDKFLFCHNGTIRQFDKIKRELLAHLNDEAFNIIRGQTDSEHFFALMIEIASKQYELSGKLDFSAVFRSAIEYVNKLHLQFTERGFSKLNIAFTDGRQLLVARYVSSETEPPISLHYTVKFDFNKNPEAILVASEVLSGYANEWQEIPLNHLLLVNENLEVMLEKV